MQIIDQFSRLSYDMKASRIPVTFLHFLTMFVVAILGFNNGMSIGEFLFFLASSVFLSTLHWYAVPLYTKLRSFYFALQGLLIVVSVVAVREYAILVLITFGAILVVQSFYFFNRMRQFILFLIVYLTYGSVNLYATYGAERTPFYLLVFLLSLVLVFLVLTIFNQKILENMALEQANERIAQLTRQNERQRMARDLHDSLIQKLIALNLKMDVIDAYVKKEQLDRAEAVIGMAKLQIGESIVEARKVVEDLRLNLDDLTFHERFVEEVEQLQFIYHLQVDLTIHIKTIPSQPLADNLVAIVKEALTNVYKHAKATKVFVQLQELDGMYALTIADDGVGIDVQQALALDKQYGLLGMQERIALFGGRFTIENEAGTKLVIQLPVER